MTVEYTSYPPLRPGPAVPAQLPQTTATPTGDPSLLHFLFNVEILRCTPWNETSGQHSGSSLHPSSPFLDIGNKSLTLCHVASPGGMAAISLSLLRQQGTS